MISNSSSSRLSTSPLTMSPTSRSTLRSTPQPVVLIKLGGSVITDKTQPLTLRPKVLSRLVNEIARARQERNELYIIGHGQGSFAHLPAQQYRTIAGFVNHQSRLGMAITQDSAAQLNRLVVAAFLAADLPAVSLPMSGGLVTNQNQAADWSPAVIDQYLTHDLLPITYGDVIVDQTQGCTIWSTEVIFKHLAQWLSAEPRYQLTKIIQVTQVAGVLDDHQQIIARITTNNLVEVLTHVDAPAGVDVTGGMKHKLTESLSLAAEGVETLILSGLEEDNLWRALTDQDWLGTTVS